MPTAISSELFDAHVLHLRRELEAALEAWEPKGGGASGVVFDAGPAGVYFRDDQAPPFRACPHFSRWVPDPAPGDLVCVRAGRPVRWLRVVERGYWHEVRASPDPALAGSYTIEETGTREDALRAIGDAGDLAYVGPDPAAAERLGIPPGARDPASLVARLDWARAYKTPYEIACIRAAAEIAGRGHRAARAGAADRRSEYAVHLAYLEAAELLETETPYPNIIAWDDRASILHYQTRRSARPERGNVFLIDAGASVLGYHCDITRTYAFEASAAFAELLRGMHTLQHTLVDACAPGQSFVELHARALRGVAELLHEVGVLRRSPDEAFERGWVDTFLPHGLGHHLGLQVHDVGGWQASPEGERREPPARWPYLRNTRELAPGHVVTIEPGVYFVRSLLEPLEQVAADAFDWRRIRELEPCGGIRIEDDVWIDAAGPRNLSRDAVQGAAPPETGPGSSRV